MTYPIQFTCTELAGRPEIVRASLESFKANVINIDLKEYEVIVNIDPVPDFSRAKETLDVLNEYFGKVTSRITTTPNHVDALKWVWATATADHVMHMEMDFEYLPFPRTRTIDPHTEQVLEVAAGSSLDFAEFYNYYRQMDKPKCNLRGKVAGIASIPGSEFNNYHISLSPGLIRKDMYKWLGEKLDSNKATNPECQFTRYQFKYTLVDNIVYPMPNDPDYIVVKDIGRPWLEANGLSKPENLDHFVSYPTKSVPVEEKETIVGDEETPQPEKKGCEGCKRGRKKKVVNPQEVQP